MDDGEKLEEDGSIPTTEECCPEMEIARGNFEETALPFISEKDLICKEWIEEFENSDEDEHEYEVSIKHDCPEHYMSPLADWFMLKKVHNSSRMTHNSTNASFVWNYRQVSYKYVS